MAKVQKEGNVFSQFINIILGGSVSIVLGALLMLIYLPFSSSIDQSFKPSPEPIKSNFQTQSSSGEVDPDRVVNGVHVATGLIYDDNFSIVRGACTSCHSAKLVTQNRATREGWKQMIRWMQATQGLQDLGEYEVKILDYLAKNYAPTDVGRRKMLNQEEIDWYTLKLK